MNPGIVFALIAALATGFYTVFQKQASPYIHYLFGAMVVSITALIISSLILLPKVKNTILFSNPKGIFFAVLVGICALAIDAFSFRTFASGIPVSVGAPIIIAGGLVISVVIGFFLGESITAPKLLAIAVIMAGSFVLARLN